MADCPNHYKLENEVRSVGRRTEEVTYKKKVKLPVFDISSSQGLRCELGCDHTKNFCSTQALEEDYDNNYIKVDNDFTCTACGNSKYKCSGKFGAHSYVTALVI